MQEIWKPIDGYEMYQVSNLGRVRRIFKHSVYYMKPHEIKGYLRVSLCKNSKQKWFMIHRLVAQAFIPNPTNLPFINHKDENPHNNVVDNIEWCTRLYNINYGTRTARTSKPVIAENDVETLRFPSINEAMRQGYNSGLICACCKGRITKYKGYKWRYSN